jgi:hypothetical protein
MPMATQIRAPGDQQIPRGLGVAHPRPLSQDRVFVRAPCRVPIAPGPCMHDRLALGAAKLAALRRPREELLHSAIASATDRTGKNHDGGHLRLIVSCKPDRASLAGRPQQTAPAPSDTEAANPWVFLRGERGASCPEARTDALRPSQVPQLRTKSLLPQLLKDQVAVPDEQHLTYTEGIKNLLCFHYAMAMATKARDPFLLICDASFAFGNMLLGLLQMEKLHRAVAAGHDAPPSCAGGSAIGLSAADAYGQSLGR